jgi:hypothetical protein
MTPASGRRELARRLRLQIARECDRVLALDLLADAQRQAGNRGTEELRETCSQRDCAAEHLAQLIEQYEELRASPNVVAELRPRRSSPGGCDDPQADS